MCIISLHSCVYTYALCGDQWLHHICEPSNSVTRGQSTTTYLLGASWGVRGRHRSSVVFTTSRVVPSVTETETCSLIHRVRLVLHGLLLRRPEQCVHTEHTDMTESGPELRVILSSLALGSLRLSPSAQRALIVSTFSARSAGTRQRSVL